MKTTIEIPDPLFRRAKAAAATQGVSLKEFLTDAIERKLRGATNEKQPTWRDLHGGLRSLRRETSRVERLIETEFETIDEEEST